uniref:Uncharacterized protein n=1 Tax=Physcomitrium patens TaxID=3218 RepID=A0A2K1L1Y0_PHYPA|nr:hypothetical protein PHYPA_002825 [Physcomitrium patens]
MPPCRNAKLCVRNFRLKGDELLCSTPIPNFVNTTKLCRLRPPKTINNDTQRQNRVRNLTDAGTSRGSLRPARARRIPLQRSRAPEQNQPRTDVSRRAFLPDRRHGRQRVPTPRPRSIFLLLDQRAHHAVRGRGSRRRRHRHLLPSRHR